MQSSPPNTQVSQYESDSDHESISSEQSQFTQDDDGPEDLHAPDGPLSNQQLVSFLKCVKSRRKPLDVAKKFTHDIPGLIKQMKPLRNSPLLRKNMQQRVRKLIRNLDPNDPSHFLTQ